MFDFVRRKHYFPKLSRPSFMSQKDDIMYYNVMRYKEIMIYNFIPRFLLLKMKLSDYALSLRDAKSK